MQQRIRRGIIALISLVVLAVVIFQATPPIETPPESTGSQTTQDPNGQAATALESLAVKGRAAKTGYSREEFGSGWVSVNGCDTRHIILNRDLMNPVIDEDCQVVSGILKDSYTGKTIEFRKETSSAIQIDHVVALSDAWQKGAQQLTKARRIQLANDPLELIAVDGPANMEKGDSDAASWLPDNKVFRCQYVARQIAIKTKYLLWVTAAEKDAMRSVLSTCPDQALPLP